jgi:hypothetical protein
MKNAFLATAHQWATTLTVEYLGELVVKYETALGNKSGYNVVLVMKKNRGRKSRETVTLSKNKVLKHFQ